MFTYSHRSPNVAQQKCAQKNSVVLRSTPFPRIGYNRAVIGSRYSDNVRPAYSWMSLPVSGLPQTFPQLSSADSMVSPLNRISFCAKSYGFNDWYDDRSGPARPSPSSRICSISLAFSVLLPPWTLSLVVAVHYLPHPPPSVVLRCLRVYPTPPSIP